MKTFKLTIRIDEGMREELRVLSKANNRSVNKQVVELIEKATKSIPKPN